MDSVNVEKRASRASAVAKAFEEMLASDGADSGTRLGTKEDLRARFGVAVATFNEALRMLESRGLVELRSGPHGGVFVADPPPLVRLGHKMLRLDGDVSTVLESIAVRSALEEMVAKEAAIHRRRRDIDDFRRIVRRMRSSRQLDDYLRANWELHRRIAQVGTNRLLADIYLSMIDIAVHHLRGAYSEDPTDVIVKGADVHARLVDAVESQDMSELDDVLKVHAALTTTGIATEEPAQGFATPLRTPL